MNTTIRPLTAFLLASGAFAAFAAETTVKAPITKAALFKNGFSAVERRIQAPETGSFIIRENPAPMHGTIWVSGKDFPKLLIRSVIRPAEDDITPQSRTDIAALYMGRQVRIVYADSKDVCTLEGTIVNPFPAPKKEGRYTEASNFYLKTQDGSLMRLQSGRVVRISSREINLKEKLNRKTLLFQIREGQKIKSPVLLDYVTQGLTWGPAYKLVLTNDKKLHLYMAAVIINGLTEDLKDTEIQLISGFPNLQFSNTLSPLAAGVSLQSYLSGLGGSGNAPMYMRSKVMSQGMSNSAADLYEFKTGAKYGALKNAGDAGDIQYFNAGKLSIDAGETLYLPLDDADAAYDRIVEWTVADRRDEWGRVLNYYNHDKEETLWDAIRFKNPFKAAMTSAPAEIVNANGEILGQTTSLWTNPDQENLLKITKALTVTGKNVENESVNTQARGISLYGRKFRNPDVKGYVLLHNYRSTEATVLIKLNFKGKFISAEEKPKHSMPVSGSFSVNPQNRLTWEVKLKPGEELKLNYQYSVLVWN